MYDCIMSPSTKGWQSGKMDIDLKIARPLTATMHKCRQDKPGIIHLQNRAHSKT